MIKKILFSLFLVISFVIYFYISLPIYSGDVKNHVVWGRSILDYGSVDFFERRFPGFSFPTYPPLTMYAFAGSLWIYQISLSAVYWLNSSISFFPSRLVFGMEWENTLISFLKLPGLIATIVFAAVLPGILKKTKEKLLVKNRYFIALLLLLNPAVIYVSSVWGQTDLLQNLLLLLAFGFLINKKLWWSFIFAGVALMTKHTILLLWGVYIFYIFKEFGLKNSLKSIAVSLIILYLSYLPFHSFSLIWPLQFYYSNFTLVDFGVAENALNMWGTFSNYEILSSNQKYLGLSFDLWGYLLFLSFIAPLSMIYFVKKTNYYQLFYYLFLVSGFYFFFFTRMHERYMIPVVLFATVLVCFKKIHWINLVYFTFLHFINLYRGLFQPGIPVILELTKSNIFLTWLVVGYAVLLVYNYIVFLKELLNQEKREKLFKWQ